MTTQRTERLSERAFALRVLIATALAIATLHIVSNDAFANDAGVTDLTRAEPGAIESFDIVAALAPARGTRIEPGAPAPTVRLPILFEFNSANLKPEGEQLLEKLGSALKTPELDTFRFAVEGHTDSVGSAGYNSSLSERRANSVKRYLTDRGVPSERLESNGMGEAQPVADNQTHEGRQRNRRVEIINLGSEG
jgi:outer membrane protein OmpA-like peptidoglycan-associated protein